MARAPFDLPRNTRGFDPILQAAVILWILWCLIASDQFRLHLSITPCTFARDRTGWCSHTHHVVWPLGFTFPKFTPGPYANSRFLVDLVFVEVELLECLDGPVSCSDELFVLVSIFLRTFGFHPVSTSCVPTSDATPMVTAERPKMSVCCEFWSRVFSWFSNVDSRTAHCPNRKQTH